MTAQILLYENVSDLTCFKVLIPTNTINVKSEETIDLQLFIDIFYKNNLKLSNQTMLKWHYAKDLNNEFLVYSFSEKFYPGNYDVRVRVINNSYKIHIENSFPINIDNQKIISSNLDLFMFNNNNQLYPNELLWHQKADSVAVFMEFSELPERIEINHNENILTVLEPSEVINQVIDVKFFDDIENVFTARVFFKDRVIFKNFSPFIESSLISQNYSYRQQLQQLRYIMSQNQYEFLRRLTDDELPYQIELFWRKNDPSPQKLNNELRDLFYKRIQFADDNFAVKGYQAGWQTDRGMIFIKYGEPDEIEIHNFMIGKYPVIIWIYYSLDKRFYFDDKKGFGFYELREEWSNY